MVVELVKDVLVYVCPPKLNEKVSPVRNPADVPAEPVMGVFAEADRVVV